MLSFLCTIERRDNLLCSFISTLFYLPFQINKNPTHCEKIVFDCYGNMRKDLKLFTVDNFHAWLDLVNWKGRFRLSLDYFPCQCELYVRALKKVTKKSFNKFSLKKVELMRKFLKKQLVVMKHDNFVVLTRVTNEMIFLSSSSYESLHEHHDMLMISGNDVAKLKMNAWRNSKFDAIRVFCQLWLQSQFVMGMSNEFPATKFHCYVCVDDYDDDDEIYVWSLSIHISVASKKILILSFLSQLCHPESCWTVYE